MISSFSSIRTKASLLFFTLFVGIILPVNWIIYQKVRSVLSEASRKEMDWEAQKLMEQVKLDPVIVPLAANYDMQLLYKDNVQEEVIFSSPGFPNLPPENYLIDYYTLDTLEIINVSKNAQSGVLVLTLVRNNIALGERLNDLKLYLFLASSISITLAAILVYLSAGWMLKPVHLIAQAADKIQASETIERVPVPNTNDESRKLAEALNAMLARIEQTIKNQTNFFASATHELKTPLANMKAELSTVDAKNDERLNGLLSEVERLDRVISDFLLISQLKSDSLAIRKKDESIEEIIYKALKKVKYLGTDGQQPDIHFMLGSQSAGYFSCVDADKMETVFINLLENAVKYSYPNSVSILLKYNDNKLEVEISNPVKDSITDAPSLTREFKKSRDLSTGLGMGLWICEQILKLHDGSLTLNSQDLSFKATVALPGIDPEI